MTSGRSSGGDAGARIEYSYRREQTSSGGSGGGSRTVTPTASTRDSSASRKVKFSEKNQEIEIDNLPDPELDQGEFCVFSVISVRVFRPILTSVNIDRLD